jgi:hypothetical protein
MRSAARGIFRVGVAAVLFGSGALGVLEASPRGPQAASGPVGYWPLDETDLNSLAVYDATSFGNNGTRTPTNGGTDTPAQISTDVAPVPGPSNLRSLYCNADTDRPEGALISDGPGASLDIAGPLTISVWVKLAASGPTRTDNMGVVERLTNPGTGYSGYFLRLYRRDVGGVFQYVPGFTTSNAGTQTAVSAANTDYVPRGTWTHLAAVFDGVNLLLYKNGTRVGSNAGSAPGAVSTTLSIGNDKGANRFHGNVDEVRVFDRALTETEIGVLINGQPAPTGLDAIPEPGAIRVRWDSAGGGVTYELFRRTSSGTYGGTPFLTTPSTSIVDAAVTLGTDYCYQVRAVSLMTSPFSNEDCARPLDPAPRTNDHDEGLFGDGRCGCGSASGPGAGPLSAAAALVLALLARAARRA